METKSGDLTIKQASEGKVIATLARLGVRDRDGDLLKAGLLSGGQLVAIKPQHKWDHVDLGVAHVYETAQGTLESALEFNMAIPSARDWYEAIRFSHEKQRRQQYSFGFEVMDFAHETHEGRPIRVLKSISLAEVSPVLIGASVGSETLMVKAPSLTRRYWPGGITTMKGAKEHVSEAVTSLYSGLRHLNHVRRVLAKSPAASKVDDDFETAMEHFESVLDILNETSLSLMEVRPLEVSPPPALPKAVDSTPPVVTTATGEEIPEAPVVSGTSEESEEKGGMPIHDELESVMQSIEQVTDRLEKVKEKRAEVSSRYPNGRPVSAERLEQVARLQTRLSRLKDSSAEIKQQDEAEQTEQQALHDMAERMKRYGVAV